MKKPANETTTIVELNTRQLKGRQSVRATFKLPNRVIELLKVAAVHLRVKQKSLLDQLIEDRETLAQLAETAKSHQAGSGERRQKTFVLSRSTLDLLDELSHRHAVSRDLLVERSIIRLVPFVKAEQEKHLHRRTLIEELEAYLEQGRTLLEKADRLLGPEDRFHDRLEKIIRYAERNAGDMQHFVKDKETLDY